MFGHKRPVQDPCKHIVAVIYKLTAAIDEDAGQLFLLRGADPSHAPPMSLPALGGSPDAHTRRKRTRASNEVGGTSVDPITRWPGTRSRQSHETALCPCLTS